MPQSNVKPNNFKIIGDKIYLYENIVEQTNEGEVVYIYDEYILNIKPRENIEQYIEDNFDALLLKIKKECVKEEIQELSNECHSNIVKGFESSCLGEVKVFDCEDYDQTNINGLALTAMMVTLGQSNEEIKYKASGELEKYVFTPEQMIELASDMRNHVAKYTEEFQEKRKVLLAMI